MILRLKVIDLFISRQICYRLLWLAILTTVVASVHPLAVVPRPDFHEQCSQDNRLCEDPVLVNLRISFRPGCLLECNGFVSRQDGWHTPEVQYTEATKDELYLLIMIDPDAPFPCAPPDITMEHILHYIAIVRGIKQKLSVEQIMLTYHPPAPPRGIHRYQLYLYRWGVSHVPQLDYIAPDNRAGFNLTVFETANQLADPVAVFQFRSKHDSSIYLYTYLTVLAFVVFQTVVGFLGHIAVIMI